MEGPSEAFRAEVASWSARLREASDAEAEEELEDLLGHVLGEVEFDIARDPDFHGDPHLVAAAVSAWTSLLSHAVGNVYAPASPFPRNLAGFGSKAIAKVQQVASALRKPLAAAQVGLGAGSYSISVEFPWGVSVGFSWP